MVKVLIAIAVVMIATACTSEVQQFSTEKAFDTSKYELENFTNRVYAFLQSRPETAGINSYQALIINTKGCSACVRGSVSSIYKFLGKTQTKTMIYTNDSSLVRLLPQNSHIAFFCLPSEEFELKEVFHNELYLYTVNDNDINSFHVKAQQEDSLNSL